MARRPFAVVALLAATACYPYWSGSELDERIQALETATTEQRRAQDELRRDFETRFSDRLQKIDEAVENLNRSAHLTTAEIGSQVDSLVKQVQEMRGLLEQTKFRFDDVEKRFNEVEHKVTALGGDKALEKLAAKKALKDIERPADKQKFFDLAKGYHAQKQYDFSRPLFGEFIEKWKFDELSPLAQLYLGDSYFDEKNYRAAILEYQKIREVWPTSKHIPDSLYKLGLSFLELGLKDEARLFLDEAAKFPSQQAGKDARAKLKELNAKPAPRPAPKPAPKGKKK